MRKGLAAVAIGVTACVLCACGTTGGDEGCANPARLILHENGIPGHWIVVYEGVVADPEQRTTELEIKYNFTASSRYSAALKGFAAQLPDEVVDALRCEAGIDFIEQDARVELTLVPRRVGVEPGAIVQARVTEQLCGPERCVRSTGKAVIVPQGAAMRTPTAGGAYA